MRDPLPGMDAGAARPVQMDSGPWGRILRRTASPGGIPRILYGERRLLRRVMR